MTTPTGLLSAFLNCRNRSLELVSGLSAEDCQIQAMPDVSPLKWHLAHTTWFFDTFLLQPHLANYSSISPHYNTLFNSYYFGVGEQFPRSQRGLLSRPSLDDVLAYRQHIDEQATILLNESTNRQIENTVRLGIAHEQQHQELMLMDSLYNFSVNPTYPSLNSYEDIHEVERPKTWITIDGGLTNIGTNQDQGFCFDNECPRHQVNIETFDIYNQLVTNAEFIEFIEAGGYQDFSYWHSDGFAWVSKENISYPLYWQKRNGQWYEYSPTGLSPLNMNSPVRHVSYYEAFAFAQFKGTRLPTEFEWETAVSTHNDKLHNGFGSAWQWTQSAYQAYPKFKPFEGNTGEYNGKFMLNQQVLRGSSYFTPQDHSRVTYRNFFYPHQRWVCAGIRLARDVL